MGHFCLFAIKKPVLYAMEPPSGFGSYLSSTTYKTGSSDSKRRSRRRGRIDPDVYPMYYPFLVLSTITLEVFVSCPSTL